MERDIKLAVVGARLKGDLQRTFTYAQFCEHMNEFMLRKGYDPKKLIYVSGGAPGVDTFAERYAALHGKDNTIILKAKWSNGKGAGFKRNTDIVATCTEMIAFPDVKNGRGTQDSIRKCKASGKECYIISLSEK